MCFAVKAHMHGIHKKTAKSNLAGRFIFPYNTVIWNLKKIHWKTAVTWINIYENATFFSCLWNCEAGISTEREFVRKLRLIKMQQKKANRQTFTVHYTVLYIVMYIVLYSKSLSVRFLLLHFYQAEFPHKLSLTFFRTSHKSYVKIRKNAFVLVLLMMCSDRSDDNCATN